MLSNVSISNGICWDDRDGLMFYVDSATGRIDDFDYDAQTGAIRGRRGFVEVPGSAGLRDGIALDAEGCIEGCIWVAVWGGSCVCEPLPPRWHPRHRVSPNNASVSIARRRVGGHPG